MKKLLLPLILLYLINFSFAADCNTTWGEELDVRVLDAKNRPIEGAEVTIYFQVSSTTGYTTTQPKLTNESGRMFMKIQNLEKQEAEVDCEFTVTAKYAGATNSRELKVHAHEKLIDVKLDIYSLIVTVKDQDGNKVEDALVSADNLEAITNEYGRAVLRLTPGEKVVYARHLGSEREATVELEGDDTEFEISFFKSDLTIVAYDDNGEKVDAVAEFAGQTYNADNGTILIPNIGVEQPEVEMRYQGITKMPFIDLSKSLEHSVVFDSNSPIIESVKEEVIGGTTSLLIIINDPGKKSSGVDENSIRVNFDAGSGWQEAKIDARGNLYAAELGKVPENTVVFFEIFAQDVDGNSVTQEGEYSTISVNPNQNQTQNGSNGVENGDNSGQNEDLDLIGLLLNVVGLIILLIIIYLIYSKFLKKTE